MYEAQTIAFMAPPFNLDDACLEALSQAFVQAGCASPSQVESWRTECQPELMASNTSKVPCSVLPRPQTCEFCKKHERTCVCSADKIVCESCTGSKRSCTFKNSFTLWLLKPWTQEQFDQLVRDRGDSNLCVNNACSWTSDDNAEGRFGRSANLRTRYPLRLWKSTWTTLIL